MNASYLPGFPDANQHLISASFGNDANEIITHWLTDGRSETIHYTRSLHGWEIAPNVTKAQPAADDRQIELLIRQDLNERPVLWAMNSVTLKGKALWDPNPQLDSLNMGKASVYHWHDGSGYEWTGAL